MTIVEKATANLQTGNTKRLAIEKTNGLDGKDRHDKETHRKDCEENLALVGHKHELGIRSQCSASPAIRFFYSCRCRDSYSKCGASLASNQAVDATW